MNSGDTGERLFVRPRGCAVALLLKPTRLDPDSVKSWLRTVTRRSFDETDTRSDEMNSTIEQWINDSVAGADEAQIQHGFQEGSDVRLWFHDYSYRNTLLISASVLRYSRGGLSTWQEDFDRHVQERAIPGSGHQSSRTSAQKARTRRRYRQDS